MSRISHELKTPLTPIIGWCDLLQDSHILGKLNEEQLRAINVISYNAGKIDNIIENIIDSQKLSKDEIIFYYEQFEISNLFSNISKYYSPIITEKSGKLFIHPFKSILIKSDQKRIEQVISNLIENSIDFLPLEGGRIELSAEEYNEFIKFTVTDNGSGISKEKQKTLLTNFYEPDETTRRKHGGIGLGLSICKLIINKLGGQIWYQSDLLKGTTFYFTILKNSLK